jgi:L-seryl-tRNA(Ser) seleniumtransferase
VTERRTDGSAGAVGTRGSVAPAGAGDLGSLPQVDAVVRLEEAAPALERHGRRRLTDAVRDVVAGARAAVRDGASAPTAEEVLERAVGRLERARRGDVTRVINATGVVVHTNLGRAPLSAAAREAVATAAGYATVEYDLEQGGRGSRTAHLGSLAAELCGTPAATVVNNGAAALLLVVAALAGGREVIVSRGELVEIGGSFRLPEVMAVSGARLVEVGTTNRTRVADYREAIGVGTGLLLKVHRSNFRQVGFTADVEPAELAELATSTGIPFAYDLGSGLVRDAVDGPLAGEPSVAGAVRVGTDLVAFSGDKLLGGPQAGIVAGRADLVGRCARHPLARALRVDKLQRAALEATLHAHLREAVPLELPTVAMLHTDPTTLAVRAAAIVAELDAVTADVAPAVAVETAELAGVVGGGALPAAELPSAGIALRTDDPDLLAAQLRAGATPVIARIEGGRVLLDLRTVPPAQDGELTRLLSAVLA